ncbi:MAG: ABC transporter permease [Alphaproteobacteria bacterium]|nr:ABC transporter permease [Alphaproteobacteria bacterium]
MTGVESRFSTSFWTQLRDSDVGYGFLRSPSAMVSAFVSGLSILAAALAPWIAPHNPFDPATYSLSDGFLPPFWIEGGSANYLLGTDGHGRDVFSSILYGARISLAVGLSAVLLAAGIGILLGLVAGYFGGYVDAAIMRIADVQLTFPAILAAMLIDGIARAVLPREAHAHIAIYVVIFAIGISNWVQYARTVRGSTLVEKGKEYVQAARVMGQSTVVILLRHVLPNVLGPALVIATIGLALAILTEATLSFLGLGLSATQASLGTLIRVGNDYLFSGEWWITIFPGAALIAIVLSVNVLGDWLRDVLNPRLR